MSALCIILSQSACDGIVGREGGEEQGELGRVSFSFFNASRDILKEEEEEEDV